MGYSISVNCKSPKVRDQMKAFLKEHFRSWVLITTGKDEPRYISNPDDDLSYATGKCQIGFDYNSGFGGIERGYYYTVLRWIALQVGKPRTKFFDPPITLSKAVPGIVYDGYEHWPVLIEKTKDKRLRWCCVDALGMQQDLDSIVEGSVGSDYFLEELCVLTQGKAVLREDAEEVLQAYRKKVGTPEGETVRTRAEILHVTRTCLEKDYEKVFGPIRDEMKRLDALWKASNE